MERARLYQRNESDTLSDREKQILEYIAYDGKSNGEISAVLHLSEKTVKNHISRVFAKLQSISRSEAVSKAIVGGHITCHCKHFSSQPPDLSNTQAVLAAAWHAYLEAARLHAQATGVALVITPVKIVEVTAE